jgi:hypothetical protein
MALENKKITNVIFVSAQLSSKLIKENTIFLFFKIIKIKQHHLSIPHLSISHKTLNRDKIFIGIFILFYMYRNFFVVKMFFRDYKNLNCLNLNWNEKNKQMPTVC